MTRTSNSPEALEPWEHRYRTMDESGAPTDAGTVAWNWIGDLAQHVRETCDPVLLRIESTPVEGGGKVTRLYRSTTLLAVATTFRDDLNYTVLTRWLAPELRRAAAQITALSERLAVAERLERMTPLEVFHHFERHSGGTRLAALTDADQAQEDNPQ